MANPVSFEVRARRFLVLAHVIFVLAIVIQMLGLALYGPKSTMALEGLALSLFALWVSFFEGISLLIARRFPLSPRVEAILHDFSFFLHLLFLGITHGLTYQFLSGT